MKLFLREPLAPQVFALMFFPIVCLSPEELHHFLDHVVFAPITSKGDIMNPCFKLPSVSILVAIFMFAIPLNASAGDAKPVTVENLPLEVTLDNLPAQPLHEPFQWQGNAVDFAPDQLGAQLNFTVPADRRLVIEYVSVEAFIDTGDIVIFSVSTSLSGVYATHTIVPTFLGPAGGFGRSYLAGQSLRLYADPGTIVTIYAGRQLGGRGVMKASISGYLCDF
ncbi:MAG: hypothetical protein HKP58_15080 [Desulfatitalea sp.]|nr:hypothetical protein [Desulfatitalea sp.]NNK01732.1 hypothetical protein [Desulfatitalea sp.]